MKNIFGTLLCIMLFGVINVSAQKAWVIPNQFNPTDEITIYVDVSQTDCQRLANTTDDLYMWMWLPAEPKVKNGEWTNSNEDLKMTRDPDNPNVYSMTFIPADFFDGISSADIYKNNFHFLVKKRDGTGEGGGGCDEDKTEDLEVAANPIPGCNTLYCQFPQNFYQDDYFTLIYNNAKEDRATMLESVVGEDNFAAFLRATLTDGTVITIASYADVINYPELSLTKDPADGFYKLEMIPREFFNLTADQEIEKILFQAMNRNYSNGQEDISSDRSTIYVGCN